MRADPHRLRCPRRFITIKNYLYDVLALLHEEDYNLDLVGFDDVELQRLLEAQDNAPGLIDEDAVPEVQPEPVARLGDLFVLGDHRLICGDCTDLGVVARLLGDAKPLLLVTDPPPESSWTASGVIARPERLRAGGSQLHEASDGGPS